MKPVTHFLILAAVTLAPLVDQMRGLIYEQDVALGTQFPELRSDKIYFLTLRGLEKPCGWSFDEAADRMCVDADEEAG